MKKKQIIERDQTCYRGGGWEVDDLKEGDHKIQTSGTKINLRHRIDNMMTIAKTVL